MPKRNLKTGTLAGLFSRLWYGEKLEIQSVGSGADVEFQVKLSQLDAQYSYGFNVKADRTEREVHDQIIAALPVARRVWDGQIKTAFARKLWKGSKTIPKAG